MSLGNKIQNVKDHVYVLQFKNWVINTDKALSSKVGLLFLAVKTVLGLSNSSIL